MIGIEAAEADVHKPPRGGLHSELKLLNIIELR